MKGHIDRLVDERWRLMNSFGNSSFRDGQIRQRIEEIDRTLSLEVERIETAYPRKFLEMSLHADAIRWRDLTAPNCLGARS